MKAALINPGTDPKYAVQEPLNLGFLASHLLANGVEVRIIDELAGQDVAHELASYKPDIAGLTATTPLAADAYRVAAMCREMGIFTVMGGVHASVMPDEALKHVDVVVKGEGETALLDIIRDDIRSGIVSRPYIKDIDSLPAPARQLLQMDFYVRSKSRIPQSYLYFVPAGATTASVLTSRGCPYSCIYCHNTWRGTPTRYNSPERVISEIIEIKRDYGVQTIFFIEDNLFVNKKRLKAICELMIEKDLNLLWGGNSRVDNIDPEILALAARAGCRQITFGFESGSQRTLNILKKKTTVEQNRLAIDMCNEAGIIPQGTFIVGCPDETLEDVRLTMKFIEDSSIESVGICIATPYPGTQLWDWALEHNLLPETYSWSDFDYLSTPINLSPAIPKAELLRLIEKTNILLAIRQKGRVNVLSALRDIVKEPSRLVTIAKSLIRDPALIGNLLRRFIAQALNRLF
ncbi:MAG: B12-binding domain-containing radical SAM protein [Candidatus Magnetominusculus sp. LBB02]|nr:B12-binding domain-containing radical SAM protein [Candidatus Magnetominusculus sp. LBB02]